MIHDKMASDMKVLRKYASPKLREVIDNELAEVKQHSQALDDLMARLKNEEYQHYMRGNADDKQREGAKSDRNSSASLQDRSNHGSDGADRGNEYLQETEFAAVAFVAPVRVERGSNGRAKLGVTFDQDRGDECRIASVRSGGPAEKAGLEPGDLILAINGREIDSVNDLRQSLANLSDGDQAKLVVERERMVSERIPLGSSSDEAQR